VVSSHLVCPFPFLSPPCPCASTYDHFLIENLGEVEVKYFLKEQQLVLYFWNLDGSFCVTVKFEYGFHEGAKRQNSTQWLQVLRNMV
jgi:hypothetical protein